MGILSAIVSPRATRSCLATAISGARSRVTWPLRTPTAPLLAAATRQHRDERLAGHPVHLHPRVRHPRAGDDLVDAAVHESGDPAGQRSRHALQQRADPGQALLRQLGSRLIGQALHVDPGDDLAGDLVGEGVLDSRILDQRLHVGDIPAGVRDLVRRPHRHHRQRRQHAAEDDQQRRDRRPPAAPAPDRLPGPVTRLGRFRVRSFPFGVLAGAGAQTCGRLAVTHVGAGHGSPPALPVARCRSARHLTVRAIVCRARPSAMLHRSSVHIRPPASPPRGPRP